MKKILLMLTFLVSSLTMFSQTTYDSYKNYYINNGWNIGLEQQASLVAGNSAYTMVNFYSGKTYKIVAMSNDVDVTDVDVFVYLPDGTLFIQDSDESSLAIVGFSCTWTQQVKIVIKNYSSRTPDYSSVIRYFIAYY